MRLPVVNVWLSHQILQCTKKFCWEVTSTSWSSRSASSKYHASYNRCCKNSVYDLRNNPCRAALPFSEKGVVLGGIE